MTALVGQRVKHVDAGGFSSCAVTEKGELYTWGGGVSGSLGHGDERSVAMPRRVERPNGVMVGAAATCVTHTLVADADGVVWACGARSALGLGDPDAAPKGEPWANPAPIPTLRVGVRKSPDVLPFR